MAIPKSKIEVNNPVRMDLDAPKKRKVAAKPAQSEAAAYRGNMDKEFTKLTGKSLDPNKGALSQMHGAMMDATKRGKLSAENAAKIRKRLGFGK